jgi:hypothetical protein
MRTQPQVNLSTATAAMIFSRAHAEGKIKNGDITRYMREMEGEINDLEARLQILREASGSTNGHSVKTSARRGPGRPRNDENKASAAPQKAKRKAQLSPEQIASRQLQGRFLAMIRQIPANKRSQYSKTAKERGREAAIKDMQKALQK